MKDFFKSVLFIATVVCAFFIGFRLGKTREKAKIPNFQEDTEGHV
jgi:hypothetical protein